MDANLGSPRVCVVACKRTVVVITVVVAVLVAVGVAVAVAVVVAERQPESQIYIWGRRWHIFPELDLDHLKQVMLSQDFI